MSREPVNMDHFFQQLEAGSQPDLSAMDQHWQQLKQLAAAGTATPPANGSSFFLKPGWWIGIGLVGTVALLSLFLYRPGTPSAKPVSAEISKPEKPAIDTAPTGSSAPKKVRSSTRRTTNSSFSDPSSVVKKQAAPSVPAANTGDGTVQAPPSPASVKSESLPTLIPIKPGNGRVRDSVLTKPPAQPRQRNGVLHLNSAQPVIDSSNVIQLNAPGSKKPVDIPNSTIYLTTTRQQQWLQSLPRVLIPFTHP